MLLPPDPTEFCASDHGRAARLSSMLLSVMLRTTDKILFILDRGARTGPAGAQFAPSSYFR